MCQLVRDWVKGGQGASAPKINIQTVDDTCML